MKILLIAISLVVVIFAGCAGASPQTEPLSPSELEAIQNYTNNIIDKLDALYAQFEQSESAAKKIADEREAPYNMAIGSMAEVRKTADETEAFDVPKGAQEIHDIAVNKLRALQAGLNKIASKDASDVSLTDPGEFYRGYLDVLIEIPELKEEIKTLASSL